MAGWVPDSLASDLETCPSPMDAETEEIVVNLLASGKEFPEKIGIEIARRWKVVLPSIRKIFPSWTPPDVGYFSSLPASFGTLLENHAILSVPASIFGSRMSDVSVITCLYYGGTEVPDFCLAII